MKNAYSTTWKSSVQPRRQRKYRHNAPYHVLQHFLSVNLSKTLRKQHGTRSLPCRAGDTVKIMRGSHKGTTGAIERVDRKNNQVYITGVETMKKDGTKTLVPQTPSKLQLQTLEGKDKRRVQESKKPAPKPEHSKTTRKSQKP